MCASSVRLSFEDACCSMQQLMLCEDEAGRRADSTHWRTFRMVRMLSGGCGSLVRSWGVVSKLVRMKDAWQFACLAKS